MYITAVIRDRHGNRQTLTVDQKCDILVPFGQWETFKFLNATNALLFTFARTIKRYADQNYTLEVLRTDNGYLAEQLRKKGYHVEESLFKGDMQ